MARTNVCGLTRCEIAIAACTSAALVTFTGCPDRPTPVPFHRPPSNETPRPPPAPTREPVRPVLGTSHPAGTRAARVASLDVAVGDRDLLQSLAVDFDSDGAQEVVATSWSEASGLVVEVFARGRPSQPITTRPPALAGCRATARLAAYRTAFVTVDLSYACAGEAKPPDPELLVLGWDSSARTFVQRETITLLGDLGRAPGTIAWTPTTEDVDGDTRDDVVVLFRVELPASTPISVPLRLLDRAGGLARGVDEPRATFDRLLTELRQAIRADPHDARLDALDAAWSSVCRESGVPRLRIGSNEGVACHESLAFKTQLRAVQTAAAIRRHDFLNAVMYDEDGGRDARGADTRPVEAALTSLRSTGEWRPQIGPPVVVPPESRISAPRVMFLEDGLIVVHAGNDVQRVFQESSLTEVSGFAAPEYIGAHGDGFGRWTLAGVHRTCAGTTATFDREGNTLETLIETRVLPPGVACSTFRPQIDDRFRAIGTTFSGVVFVRGTTALVAFPGQTNPTVVGGDSPLPAPLLGGACIPDGSRCVVGSRFGVVLFERATRRAELLRAAPSPRELAAATDAALAPDGHAIAAIVGGKLTVFRR